MPSLGQTFDANAQQDMNSFEPLPEGDYKMMITSSEIKEASTGPGNSYLQLDMKVLEGENANKVFISRLNLWNANTTAVEIANKEFGAICKAIGKPLCENSDDLHNIPLTVTLKVTPPKGNYGPGNAAKGYSSATGNPAPSAPAAPSPATPPAAAIPPQASNPAPAAPAAETPPWG